MGTWILYGFYPGFLALIQAYIVTPQDRNIGKRLAFVRETVQDTKLSALWAPIEICAECPFKKPSFLKT